MTDPAGDSRLMLLVRYGAWAVIMFNALARVVVALDPFPQWAMDPSITTTPRTALGPTATLALDAATLLAAALVWLGESAAGRRPALIPIALTLVGVIGVAIHGFRDGIWGGWVDDLRLGASWVAAIAGGLATAHLAREPRIRRLTIAVGVGVIGMLAAKGALEVFIEHPELRRRFETDSATVFGAHGWSEDSPMARGFRRRLEQAEATGWFGLANVYASFAAASMVTLVGIGAVAWLSTRPPRQSVPDGVAAIISLAALVAGGCVVMAGSKAGYAVAALGLVVLAVGWLAGRWEKGGGGRWLGIRGPILGGPLAFAIIAAVLGAVVVRGAAGESIGERSLLFRWFYLQGAARVVADHPVLGTGPAGFKDAYMLVKPPLSPEAVESPHSIAFDLSARLGLPGLALAAVFGWLVWRAGTAVTNPIRPPPDPSTRRTDFWWLIAFTAAPALLSAWFETPITTLESALTRGLGLLAWGAIAWASLWVMRTTTAWTHAAAAGAVVLAAHAQIEMTPVQPASAPLLFLLLGAATHPSSPTPAPRAARAAGCVLGVAHAVAAAGLFAFGVLPVARWERGLVTASGRLETLASIRARLTSLPTTGPAGRDSIESIARDLGAAVGRPPPRDDYQLDESIRLLTTTSLDRAAVELAGAATAVRHPATLEALSRLHLAHAAASPPGSESIERHGVEAERIADQAAAMGRGRASSLGWLGTVRATRAEQERDPAHLERAVEAWKQAAASDPNGITFAWQVFQGLVQLQRTEEAREWAIRIFALNEQARLDPLIQLTDNQQTALRRVLGGQDP